MDYKTKKHNRIHATVWGIIPIIMVLEISAEQVETVHSTMLKEVLNIPSHLLLKSIRGIINIAAAFKEGRLNSPLNAE